MASTANKHARVALVVWPYDATLVLHGNGVDVGILHLALGVRRFRACADLPAFGPSQSADWKQEQSRSSSSTTHLAAALIHQCRLARAGLRTPSLCKQIMRYLS
jgi:hypothetical protein